MDDFTRLWLLEKWSRWKSQCAIMEGIRNGEFDAYCREYLKKKEEEKKA